MAKKLQILLEVKSDGTVAIDKVVGGLNDAGDAADKASGKTRGLGKSFEELNVKGGQLAGTLLTAVAGASTAAAGLASLVVGIGVKHNAQLEQSRLAMAALASSMGEIRDGNGQLLEGQEKWNAAIGISKLMVQDLQVAALKTTAEFGDLVRVMQEGMGPALRAGFDRKQIVEFVQLIAQMGGALGIQGDRLGQEIRAVLAGEKGPDNQIANALFGDVEDVKAKLAELKKSGELFDYLKAKMADFAKAGEEAGNTFDGALSNLKDAVTQALGEATQGATSDFTVQMKELTAEIVTFDAAGKATFNQDFVDGVRSVAGGFVSLAEGLVTVTREIPDALAGMKDLLASMNEFSSVVSGTSTGASIGDRAKGYATTLLDPFGARSVFGARGPRETRAGISDWIVSGDSWDSIDMYGTNADTRFGWDVQQQAGRDAALARKRRNMMVYPEPIGPEMPESTLAGKGGGPGGDDKAGEQLRKQLDDYKAWVEEAKALAASAGDPLKEALAKIESDRLEAIKKIENANKGIPGAFKLSKEATEAQNVIADSAAIKALVKQWEVGLKERADVIEKADQAAADSAAATGAILTDIQKSVEDDRIAAIEDSVERELQTRLAANDEWYSQMVLQAQKEITVEAEKAEVLKKLADEKKRRDELAQKEAEKVRREDLAGTKEWAEKTRAIEKQNLGSIATDMTGVFNDSAMAVRGAFDDLFSGIVDGQLDVVGTLKDFGKQMGNIWGQMLSSILTRTLATGDSLTSQLKGMWDSIGGGPDGTMFDAAMGGAGVGSLVGGLAGSVAGPNTYASEGGLAGGIIGGIVGYFVGGVGGVKWGAAIGSAIGSAIGASIGKDSDEINLEIRNGIAMVTEHGLSGEGRNRLQRDIQRTVNERVKSWESLLDLFPKEIQAGLDELVRPINFDPDKIKGDFTDAGALSAMGDILSEGLNRNLFDAFRPAIEAGLAALGVDKGRIFQQFKEWGYLTGEELEGAVRDYVTAVVESVRVRDLFKPFEPGDSGDIRGDARDLLAAQKPEARIKAMIADLDELVSALPKLDPSDQVAAMQQVNQLGQQIWDNMIAHLQRIDAIQQQIAQTAQSMRDQVTLAGLDDQGKMDFYFSHLGDIREQMSVATDPEEVQRLYQQAMQYIQSALALDPDNKDLRDKLMGIIGDMEGVAGEQLGEARDRVMEEQLAAYELLSEAAQTLLDAVEGLPTGQGIGGGGGGGGGGGAPGGAGPGTGGNGGGFTQGAEKLDAAAAAAAEELGKLVTAAAAAVDVFGAGALIAGVSGAATDPKAGDILDLFMQLQGMAGGAALGSAPPPSPDAMAQIQALLLQLLAAQQAPGGANGKVTVELTGPGVDFMQQVGMSVHQSVVSSLRNNSRLLTSNFDS